MAEMDFYGNTAPRPHPNGITVIIFYSGQVGSTIFAIAVHSRGAVGVWSLRPGR